MTQDSDGAAFEAHRTRLFGIAYRMLGSVEDAKDLVQETYLRWHQADPALVRNTEAWLVAVVTRLAIDRLRSAASKREQYVGEWLPEPIATGEEWRPDHRTELASDLSMAFLVLLERLGPEERAAFLLREVFGVGYEELARVLDKSEAACRQILHRARVRVRGERARYHVPAETKERLLERFLAALAAEDREALLAVVAEDATFISDGGGRVAAARKAIHGVERVARLLLGAERKWGRFLQHDVAWVNDEPTIVTSRAGQLVCTTSIETDGEHILAFYRVLNPDKLKHVAEARSRMARGRDEGTHIPSSRDHNAST